MANSAGQFFKESEKYINEVCQAFIEPHKDLMKVSCRHMGSDGIGYIKLVDATDSADYFDITGLDMSGICELMASIVTVGDIPARITDYQAKKEVAKLFR